MLNAHGGMHSCTILDKEDLRLRSQLSPTRDGCAEIDAVRAAAINHNWPAPDICNWILPSSESKELSKQGDVLHFAVEP